MPRKPRFYLPCVPVHFVHRGHSRSPVFLEDEDYTCYLHWLKEASEKYNLPVHAFVLMTNHVHILATPQSGSDASLFMQYLGRRYVPFFNRKYGQSGSIWEGRYKASVVQEERYFFSVMRYIELNPVRANMVDSPSHYRWSSFCHNAGLRSIQMLTPHAIYNLLGRDKEERAGAYKGLFNTKLDAASIKRINDAWLTGTPLGNDRFKAMVEEKLRRKVGQDRRGRPKSLAGREKA